MMNANLRQFDTALINIVRQDVVPALGCTEPISVALACATAMKYLEGNLQQIEVKVSPNLMKNGLGVTVPGTGMVGLPIAAAAGALAGDSAAGLEVLKNIQPEQVCAAKTLLAEHKVKVGIAQTPHILYSEATLYSDNKDWVKVVIHSQHTNIVCIEKIGEMIYQKPEQAENESDPYQIFTELSAEDIFDFSMQIELDKIAFIQDAERLNSSLSQEGLAQNYGLHIGRTLQQQLGKGLLSDDLLSRIMIETTAASDARMGGATLPAMSNSGSGNQGITATMPVVTVANYLNVNNEQRIRALFLSHLMAIFIHSKLPKLSALCAVTTAAMGSCAGIAYLLTGKFETAAMAICSMIGDISGIICDGAANSCAMKVSTSVSSAYKAVLMAMDQTCVTGDEGIVEKDVDQSINNLCAIACQAMQHTDYQIIEIMAHKVS